jgi:hypothetical protein
MSTIFIGSLIPDREEFFNHMIHVCVENEVFVYYEISRDATDEEKDAKRDQKKKELEEKRNSKKQKLSHDEPSDEDNDIDGDKSSDEDDNNVDHDEEEDEFSHMTVTVKSEVVNLEEFQIIENQLSENEYIDNRPAEENEVRQNVTKIKDFIKYDVLPALGYHNAELRTITKDGKPMWVVALKECFYKIDDDDVGIFGILSDFERLHRAVEMEFNILTPLLKLEPVGLYVCKN